MKNLVGIFVIILISVSARAQGDESKMRAARVGFITSRLDLTPQQAEKFWPVYNEYVKKREEIQMNRRRSILENREDGISNDEARQMIDNELKNRQNEIALDKEYLEKLQAVIEPTQVLRLMRAEREFNMEVLRNIAGRPEDGVRRRPQKENPPDHRK